MTFRFFHAKKGMGKNFLFCIFYFIVLSGMLISCSKKDNDERKILKVAMAKVGKKTQIAWNNAASEFEKRFPDIKIDYLGMNQDQYETSGLTSMLLYDNPDIFFEWGGERVATRVKEGNAADLTDALAKNRWRESFSKASWEGLKVNDRYFMVPYSSQISSVFWYNKSMFNQLGLHPPENWAQFINVCEILKRAGITPIYLGNKDLWPAGNLMGHLVSRIVGEREFQNALMLKRKFNAPDFLEAFTYIHTFWEKRYINKNVNGLSSDEGFSGWIRGKGAMLLLGSWVVELILDEAPDDFEYDFFNLPAISGKKGDQTSIMGLNVGFIANAKTDNLKEAVSFLRFITSPEMAKIFISTGDLIPFYANEPSEHVPPATTKLIQLLDKTTTIVSPPDTGYDLRTADAFYRAVAKVIGGVSTPMDALTELDMKLGLSQ